MVGGLRHMTHILIIAGTDSSGGAGLTRDVAVANALGVEVTPVVTAVTAQTHKGVLDIMPVRTGLVADQISAALASAQPSAIKIGMLGNDDIAQTVADALQACSAPVVLDPVLASSSGGALLQGALPKALIARTTLLTPNLPEAAALTNRCRAQSPSEISTQAHDLLTLGTRAVLIKGGHGQGDQATDHLFTNDNHIALDAPRINVEKRGTGCALSTAIACQLAQGLDLTQACRSAKDFVHQWLGGAPMPYTPAKP